MIDLTIHEETLHSAVDQAREQSIRIPTFKQMRDPDLIPEDVHEAFRDVASASEEKEEKINEANEYNYKNNGIAIKTIGLSINSHKREKNRKIISLN